MLKTPLPLTYVTLHVLVMTIVLAPYFFGRGIPDIPLDDMYIPYFLYPGYIPTIPGWLTAGLLWPEALNHMSHQMGSRMCIFYVPGAVNLILYSAAWYIVGVFVSKKIVKSANKPQEATGVPPAPQL